jgi:Iap family predicted aminopeptidase
MRALIGAVFVLLIVAIAVIAYLTRMPRETFSGNAAPLTAEEKQLADSLKQHVQVLASDIGERNTEKLQALNRAADYINSQLTSFGYAPQIQEFAAGGKRVKNIYCEIKGTSKPDELVIIGAHYDSVVGTPGADDNASGVSALLEIARASGDQKLERSVQFIFFVNEEPPYFQTPDMGSFVYAKSLRDANRRVHAMLAIESIGFYSDSVGSQHYPAEIAALYPSTANFIAFAANIESATLLREVVNTFRRTTQFPSEGGAVPESVPGVGWSDHWSFWQHGYPGVMVTDTAIYRNPHYHQPTDTVEKLDYVRTSRVTTGLFKVTKLLANH